ncbi:MAG TPA: helix-turn-helix transcriptional regulator [Streptosporangiaceae bacterium]|nr:helix-turn-helix transcriptional regulator [Streptosporangiaceae bacterium]
MSPVNVSSIGSYIREQREQAKISIRQLAQAAGVSNPYLSQVERGLRRPSADILQQIAKGLRISAEALYVQAGILDDKPGETSVTDAVMADTEITERQKQMLLDIYESFRKEVRADAEARAAEAEARATAQLETEAGEADYLEAEELEAAAEAEAEAQAIAHAKAEVIADAEPVVRADPELEAEAEAVAEAEVSAWADLDPHLHRGTESTGRANAEHQGEEGAAAGDSKDSRPRPSARG